MKKAHPLFPPFEKGGLGGISKPKAPKNLPPLTAEELAELPELPDGWLWHRLGLSTCSVEYGTSAKSEEEWAELHQDELLAMRHSRDFHKHELLV